MKKFSLLISGIFFFSALSVFASYEAGQEAFDNRDWVKAVNELRGPAQSDSRAQYYMGFLYLNGLGVVKDDKRAAEYLKKAQNEDARAQSLLAYLYNTGRGVPLDKKRALRLYEQSAEKGVNSSYLNLGIMYLLGDGVVKNYDKAKEYFEKTDATKYPAVYQYFARLYTEDSHLRDYDKAMTYYKMAAKVDSDGDLLVKTNPMDAYYMLGQMYQRGVGVSKSFPEASKYYLYAAANNHGPARYMLGTSYISGDGVGKDQITGYAWILLAADSQFPQAITKQDDLFASLSSSEMGRVHQRKLDLTKQLTSAVDPLADFQVSKEGVLSSTMTQNQPQKPTRPWRRPSRRRI